MIDVEWLFGMELIRANKGLVTWLAPRLGITQGSISAWRRVPAERVPDIERVTGIARHFLRPDLWPPPWAYEPEASLIRKHHKAAANVCGGSA